MGGFVWRVEGDLNVGIVSRYTHPIDVIAGGKSTAARPPVVRPATTQAMRVGVRAPEKITSNQKRSSSGPKTGGPKIQAMLVVL